MKKYLFLIYGTAAYFMFLATILYLFGFIGNFVVPKSIDSGTTDNWVLAVITNMFWIVLFGLQHSIMARPAFKKIWVKIIPPAIERSTYVLFSNLILIGLFVFWQPLTATIWSVSGLGAIAIQSFFILGVTILFLSTFMIDHFELFGLKQIWFNFKDKKLANAAFQTNMLYQLCRHPIMLGFILILWATPVMSAGHLLLAISWTIYILIALKYEEADLLNMFGDKYKTYQQNVPQICPFSKMIWASKKRTKKINANSDTETTKGTRH